MTEQPQEEFVVTFGQRYAREPHPVLRDAHPGAYVTITADSISHATRAAHVWLQSAFAFVYHRGDFDAARWAPRGEIGRRSAVEVLQCRTR